MNHKNQRSDIYPLFETFWNNTGLRGSLFGPNIDPNDEIIYNSKKLLFIDWVLNQNPLIFNYIEVK